MGQLELLNTMFNYFSFCLFSSLLALVVGRAGFGAGGGCNGCYDVGFGVGYGGLDDPTTEKCITNDKVLCKFPFKYEDKTHNVCTCDGDSKNWCATKTDSSGNYIKGEWGYCNTGTCTTGLNGACGSGK